MALNDQIQAYLSQNNITYEQGDYMAGQPEGQPDQILKWDAKLGPQPTQQQLDDAWATYSASESAKTLQAGIVTATQARLNDFAKTRNYDGILSLCTYATDANPKFQAEGQYGVASRSATWAKLYSIMAEVEAGTRPMPTGYADIEPELPALVWPN